MYSTVELVEHSCWQVPAQRSSLGGGRDGASSGAGAATSDCWRWAMNEPQLKQHKATNINFKAFSTATELSCILQRTDRRTICTTATQLQEMRSARDTSVPFQELSSHLRRQRKQHCVSCFSARNQRAQHLMHARMRRSFSSHLKGLQQHQLPFRKHHLRVGRRRNERTFQPVSHDGFDHGVRVQKNIQSRINVVHPLVERHIL